MSINGSVNQVDGVPIVCRVLLSYRFKWEALRSGLLGYAIDRRERTSVGHKGEIWRLEDKLHEEYGKWSIVVVKHGLRNIIYIVCVQEIDIGESASSAEILSQSPTFIGSPSCPCLLLRPRIRRWTQYCLLIFRRRSPEQRCGPMLSLFIAKIQRVCLDVYSPSNDNLAQVNTTD